MKKMHSPRNFAEPPDFIPAGAKRYAAASNKEK
jgi:hypothetical protein